MGYINYWRRFLSPCSDQRGSPKLTRFSPEALFVSVSHMNSGHTTCPLILASLSNKGSFIKLKGSIFFSVNSEARRDWMTRQGYPRSPQQSQKFSQFLFQCFKDNARLPFPCKAFMTFSVLVSDHVNRRFCK